MKKMNLTDFFKVTDIYRDDFIPFCNKYDSDNSFFVIYFPNKKHYLSNIYKNGSVRTYHQSICALRFHYSKQLFLYLEYCKYRGYEVIIKQFTFHSTSSTCGATAKNP